MLVFTKHGLIIQEKETKRGGERQKERRFWLSKLFREQKWRFRRPQKKSRKLPADYQEQVHDMILRGAFVVSTYMIPPELFINADHAGIMQLQVKGSGWFTADDARERNFEMQGHGSKNQFILVVGSSASGSILPAQLIFQGKTDKACPNNMKFKASGIQPAPGGKKKEREAAVAGVANKITCSFVPDFSAMPEAFKFRGTGSVAVTHDHWADANTS